MQAARIFGGYAKKAQKLSRLHHQKQRIVIKTKLSVIKKEAFLKSRTTVRERTKNVQGENGRQRKLKNVCVSKTVTVSNVKDTTVL